MRNVETPISVDLKQVVSVILEFDEPPIRAELLSKLEGMEQETLDIILGQLVDQDIIEEVDGRFVVVNSDSDRVRAILDTYEPL